MIVKLVIFLIAAAILIILTIGYLWCMKPCRITNARGVAIAPFTETYIAHRGLFDNKLSIPENSMPAFRRAVKMGYGIELDVRLTKDNRLVVFHDKTLERMCGEEKLVKELEYGELLKYRLAGTDCKIPLLEEVLKVIDEKVPLIIEVKAEKEPVKTAQLLFEKLAQLHYEKLYCVESFYPMVLKWIRKNRPEVIRGQLISDYIKNGQRKIRLMGIVLNGLLLNVFSRPDFIAYHYPCATDAKYRLMRRLYTFTSAGWTFKKQEELEKYHRYFQIVIFDSFIPHDS